MAFASHHLIYIDQGVTAEVGGRGTDCQKISTGYDEFGRGNYYQTILDMGLKSTVDWGVKYIAKKPVEWDYKNNMNYFGLANMYDLKYRWLEDYKQAAKGISIYDIPGDNDKNVIISRLERTRDLLGPWDYSLMMIKKSPVKKIKKSPVKKIKKSPVKKDQKVPSKKDQKVTSKKDQKVPSEKDQKVI